MKIDFGKGSSHPAKLNFGGSTALGRQHTYSQDGRSTEQRIVFVEESDLCCPLGQCKSGATALKAAA
jgi:hypothetical protein